MSATGPTIQTLYDTLICELMKALALKQTRFANGLVQMMFGKAARRVAELGIGLNREVAKGGLPGGASWLLPNFVKGHSARGVENIPAQGPLVIASNHPAAVDSLVISAHVMRPDYKVIIGDIPFFENLPHVREHAIFAPEDNDMYGRMRAVRESLRHLKSGGALLIFARGGIEADPDFMPNPDGEFNQWSRSLEIFLEHVPQTRVLVTIVSGVMMQFAQQILSGREKFGLTPRITFGEVIAGAHQNVLDQVQDTARRVLKQHMEWQV
jgi:hypothetical protein